MHYIKIGNRYYPVDGIMFARFRSGKGISIFAIGDPRSQKKETALEVFEGEQAQRILAWLNKVSLDLTVELEDETQ